MAQSHILGPIASLRAPIVVVAQIAPQALAGPSELQQLDAASRLTWMRECQQNHPFKLSELLSPGDRATSTTSRKIELASGYQRLVAV